MVDCAALVMRIRKDTLVRIRQKAHQKRSRLNVTYSIPEVIQMRILIVGVGDNGNGNNPLFFEIIEIIYRGIEKWPISLVS